MPAKIAKGPDGGVSKQHNKGAQRGLHPRVHVESPTSRVQQFSRFTDTSTAIPLNTCLSNINLSPVDNQRPNDPASAQVSLARDFDWAVLASCDHMSLLVGTFGVTAAILGNSDRVFLVEFFPGATVRSRTAMNVFLDRLADRDSGGRGRFHFFQNPTLKNTTSAITKEGKVK